MRASALQALQPLSPPSALPSPLRRAACPPPPLARAVARGSARSIAQNVITDATACRAPRSRTPHRVHRGSGARAWSGRGRGEEGGGKGGGAGAEVPRPKTATAPPRGRAGAGRATVAARRSPRRHGAGNRRRARGAEEEGGRSIRSAPPAATRGLARARRSRHGACQRAAQARSRNMRERTHCGAGWFATLVGHACCRWLWRPGLASARRTLRPGDPLYCHRARVSAGSDATETRSPDEEESGRPPEGRADGLTPRDRSRCSSAPPAGGRH